MTINLTGVINAQTLTISLTNLTDPSPKLLPVPHSARVSSSAIATATGW